MTDQPRFATTYTPDYGEMFAVAMASRGYHYTATQRHIWWIPLLLFAAAVFGTLYLSDHVFIAALEPLVGEALAAWTPLVPVIGLWALFTWLICYKLSPAMSARWIAQRKPPEPLAFSADEAGLRWEGENSGSWMKWPAVERMFLTKDSVCFLVGGVTHYVPRRIFKDQPELAAFVSRALAALTTEARARSEADASVMAVRGA